MPTRDDLAIRSDWAEHEFRVILRPLGWAVKRTGVESLFHDRKGALRAISTEFSGCNLALRSLPDMAARSSTGTYLVEIKAVEDGRRNAALELFQLAFLRELELTLGADVFYMFGRPDDDGDQLAGGLTRPAAIKPFRIDMPARVDREWPETARLALNHAITKHWPDVEVRRNTKGAGSGDPYALVTVDSLRQHCDSIRTWAKKHGPGGFGKPGEKPTRKRISWEGDKDARQSWPHIPWKKYLEMKHRKAA